MKHKCMGVAIFVLGILMGAGPAMATSAETQTAAVATQTAALTRTTGAMTATALAAGTQTAIATPTPNAGQVAKHRQVLNQKAGPNEPKLGELLAALWNSRQIGGALTVVTAGPVLDVGALTAAVNGVLVIKTATAGAAITACGNTTFETYKKCTLCVSPAGTLTWRPGTAALSQELALKPLCAHDEVEVAYLQIPPSFTSNTTSITAQMLKQDPTLRESTAVFGQR